VFVTQQSAQRVVFAFAEQAHSPPLPVHEQAAGQQGNDLGRKRPQHGVQVSVVVLLAGAISRKDSVVGNIRARLVDEAHNNLDSCRASTLVNTHRQVNFLHIERGAAKEHARVASRSVGKQSGLDDRLEIFVVDMPLDETLGSAGRRHSLLHGQGEVGNVGSGSVYRYLLRCQRFHPLACLPQLSSTCHADATPPEQTQNPSKSPLTQAGYL